MFQGLDFRVRGLGFKVSVRLRFRVRANFRVMISFRLGLGFRVMHINDAGTFGSLSLISTKMESAVWVNYKVLNFQPVPRLEHRTYYSEVQTLNRSSFKTRCSWFPQTTSTHIK